MSSLLQSLYSNRRQGIHSKEDFLSTALAGLMRRDRVACAIVLNQLGLLTGGDLAHRAVAAQFRLPNTRQKPDLRVQLGSGGDAQVCLIECKLEADAHKYASEQVARYEEQVGDDVPVGLIVAREHEPDWKSEEWAGFKRHCTWEDVVEALRKDSARLDPRAIPPLRLDWIALADTFGVGGVQPLAQGDVQRAVQSHQRVQAWRSALRAGVHAMIAADLVEPAEEADPDDPRSVAWHDNGPLETWWESDEAPADCPWIEGLGLAAQVSHETGSPTLSWWLYLFVGETFQSGAAEALVQAGWQGDQGEWRWLALGDTPDLHTNARDELARVVELARGALAEVLPALPLATGPAELPESFSGQLDSHLADLVLVDESTSALDSWETELRIHLLHALVAKCGDNVRQGKGARRSGKIFVKGFRQGGREIQLNSWSWLGDGAGLYLWIWLGKRSSNDKLLERVKDSVELPPGWCWRQSTARSRDVQIFWEPAGAKLRRKDLVKIAKTVAKTLKKNRARIRSW